MLGFMVFIGFQRFRRTFLGDLLPKKSQRGSKRSRFRAKAKHPTIASLLRKAQPRALPLGTDLQGAPSDAIWAIFLWKRPHRRFHRCCRRAMGQKKPNKVHQQHITLERLGNQPQQGGYPELSGVTTPSVPAGSKAPIQKDLR